MQNSSGDLSQEGTCTRSSALLCSSTSGALLAYPIPSMDRGLRPEGQCSMSRHVDCAFVSIRNGSEVSVTCGGAGNETAS